jgi:hypothetical protein
MAKRVEAVAVDACVVLLQTEKAGFGVARLRMGGSRSEAAGVALYKAITNLWFRSDAANFDVTETKVE